MKLSEEEIRKRLVKLRNYEVMYPRLKAKYEQLKKEVKMLKRQLQEERRLREETVEALKLQVEELREMVFGRKRGGGGKEGGGGKTGGGDPGTGGPDAEDQKGKEQRSASSYRRPTPKEEEVTQESFHGIDRCPDCGEVLTNLKEVIRYLEDIVLPLLAINPLKTVEKQRIETGFCPRCRRWHSSLPIQKQICSLGENVRQRIVYAITILGLSFEKVKSDLRDTFDISVSDGEIAHLLTLQACRLLPEYHAIDGRIRESPCQHLDETSWPVQKEGEGQWAWVKTASDSPDMILRLGRSRGKGNALELISDRDQPTLTDDYPAYDHCSKKSALCWAHPKRKFQDLAESSTLAEERRCHCQDFYHSFCDLMKAVQEIREVPYNRVMRAQKAEEFTIVIRNLCTSDPADPKKLATLKATFLANTDRYLLCVREPNIPMTNNKAERSLRPLVIKRKISFGSKTQKGADVMSILMSVCFTTWWKNPGNFFSAYQAIFQKWQAV